MAQTTSNLLETFSDLVTEGYEKTPETERWNSALWYRLWTGIARASRNGEPVNWSSLAGPPEIFHAMDLACVMHEPVSTWTCSLPGRPNERYIDAAHAAMVTDHVCSNHKIMIGAALLGDLPRPTTICHTIQPCDSIVASYSSLADRLGVPHFGVDIPMWRDERAVGYIADELEEMVVFLEAHTGKRLTDDRLRRAMEKANEARALNARANQLLTRVPSPLPGPANALAMGAGLEECTQFYRGYLEAGLAKAERGEGYCPGERIRLAWFSTGLAHDETLGGWLRDEFGAVIVNDMIGTDTSVPAPDLSSRRKMLEAISQSLILAPMSRECWGMFSHWQDHAVAACRDYHVDAVLMTVSLGCKSVWGATKLLRDRILDETGIPSLVVEADICDARTYSLEDTRARISAFLDMVRPRAA
jgi:benzoyl-CoA reductase/2-hydroxyglutaryl-CoA dehydratase subunit BcrC/BadD/HgdB